MYVFSSWDIVAIYSGSCKQINKCPDLLSALSKYVNCMEVSHFATLYAKCSFLRRASG